MLLRINTKASISSYKDILINLAKFRTFVPVKEKKSVSRRGERKVENISWEKKLPA